MEQKLRRQAEWIVKQAIAGVLPDQAVRRALEEVELTGRVVLVAVGKAAWQMAKTAWDCLGGRNQELALSAAKGIEGLGGVCVFSVGSDGTDGPTDAAGGYADGNTAPRLREMGIEIDGVLAQNDSYHALEKVNGLIITGPTGTNVNDVAVVLINP